MNMLVDSAVNSDNDVALFPPELGSDVVSVSFNSKGFVLKMDDTREIACGVGPTVMRRAPMAKRLLVVQVDKQTGAERTAELVASKNPLVWSRP